MSIDVPVTGRKVEGLAWISESSEESPRARATPMFLKSGDPRSEE
jgi:hypothetical protein